MKVWIAVRRVCGPAPFVVVLGVYSTYGKAEQRIRRDNKYLAKEELVAAWRLIDAQVEHVIYACEVDVDADRNV